MIGHHFHISNDCQLSCLRTRIRCWKPKGCCVMIHMKAIGGDGDEQGINMLSECDVKIS